jgi:GAF domain-containing protein
MLYGGILVGVLAVHEVGKSTRKFTDADTRLLMLLASQASSAVNNAQLLEGTKQRAGEFAALYETASELSTSTDLSPLLDTIARRAMTLLNAPGGAMYLYDQARGDL